MLWIVGR
jgi:hypothetical protein